MNGGETYNGHASAEFEAEAQQPRDERAWLEQQAEEAKQAFLAVLGDLPGTLKTAADVRLWAQHHPWLSVSVAATAGFVLARSVYPGADGAGADHLAEGASAGRPSRAPGQGQRKAGGERPPGLRGFLFDLAKEALSKFAVSAIRSGAEGFASHADVGTPAGARHEAPTTPAGPSQV